MELIRVIPRMFGSDCFWNSCRMHKNTNITKLASKVTITEGKIMIKWRQSSETFSKSYILQNLNVRHLTSKPIFGLKLVLYKALKVCLNTYDLKLWLSHLLELELPTSIKHPIRKKLLWFLQIMFQKWYNKFTSWTSMFN